MKNNVHSITESKNIGFRKRDNAEHKNGDNKVKKEVDLILITDDEVPVGNYQGASDYNEIHICETQKEYFITVVCMILQGKSFKTRDISTHNEVFTQKTSNILTRKAG